MIFKRTKSEPQRVVAKKALERGEILDMMSMLFDYGIGNHTGVIAKVRKMYEAEGKGYDYVHTEFRWLKSRRTGNLVRVAYYFIPEKVNDRKLKNFLRR